MIKFFLRAAALLTLTIAAASCGKDDNIPPAKTDPPKPPQKEVEVGYLLGSLVGIEQHIRWGDVTAESQKYETNSTRYNYPLFKSFKATKEERSAEWWDNLVEEIAHSGMDYAMINTRGLAPDPTKYNDHGDPRRIEECIEAMKRRGLEDKFKIAVFDDCPASWAASRNMDINNEYSSNLKFPYPLDQIDDNPTTGAKGIYPYIWDHNIKIAFEKIEDKYLMKFKERPLLYIWSPNSFVKHDGSANGKLSPILKRLRKDFQEHFKVNPFIVTDHAFQHRDKTVDFPIVDGMNAWFGMEYDKRYTNIKMDGVGFGVCVPGFSINDLKNDGENHMFIDADHGKRLITSLTELAKAKSDIVLVEGFTDVYENAALWRSTDTKFYDYPNQRLNIIRRFNRNPDVVWPKERKIEAEGCDFYLDKTKDNSGNAYREGDIDVAACDDTYVGWHVTDATAGEWLKWRELPFRDATTTFSVRYRSSAVAEVCFTVDKKDCAKVSLPSSGGVWKTAPAGTVAFGERGLHDVTIQIVSGTLEINFFEMKADK